MADRGTNPPADCADGANASRAGGTDNSIHGDVGAAVQAGAIHGDVHISAGKPEEPAVLRQLPLAASGFVNRSAELSLLDSLLSSWERAAADGAPEAVVISAIGGAPGIGKTALALHWAHRVRSRFPDGDLYVNLHGHGPGPRLDAAAALESLLRALGVAPERIPLDLDGRAALFRSRLDGRRMLIVLDDAVSAAQVRPLLPASPSCLVLVTSRSTLAGLVAREGARRMTLEMLSVDESLALLREHLGAERIGAEPEAARALVDHCARLPLALRVLAERLNELPDTPLSTVAAELAAEDERLDALGITGDELSDVRAVFSASYGALPDEAAQVFRILGAHPGGDFTAALCAAAAGLPQARTRRLLEHLAGASLIQRLASDRYRMHDLLRVYAVERFRAEEPAGQEAAVLGRIGAWYATSARNAVRAVLPNFRFVDLGDYEHVEPPEFASTAEALAWFTAERENIVQTVRAARDLRLDDLAWRLPATVYPLFEYGWYWADWREIHLVGLEAARSLGDRHGEARNLVGLGDAEWSRGENDTALGRFEAALAAAREAGDGWSEGFALRQLGVLRLDHDGDRAHDLLWEAVEVFRGAGERRGEGMALLSLAEYEREHGVLETAERRARAAVDLFAGIADTWTTAWAGRTLAGILAASGRLEEAVAEYRSAIAVFEEQQNLEGVALARMGAGRAYASAGRTDEARAQLGAALDILHSMEDPRAEEVEAEIGALE
ncbi:hypothetical protein FZ103_12810 [Streptomonospora sp. PA3]|uniref:ATP-binding protein n=1 Tax=Streptomonospora sp. PA3 TaxID=2607326 RepID=UPI0012DE6C07|nr:tetratricopeptide repeat protein [Streptomonospora sp. PA3]MUL42046.1 hypothetical protein [Streptomonospora sp. PA3]